MPFSVNITDPDGKTSIWSDDDMDGIIYKKDIAPGTYKVAMEELSDAKYAGYAISTKSPSLAICASATASRPSPPISSISSSWLQVEAYTEAEAGEYFAEEEEACNENGEYYDGGEEASYTEEAGYYAARSSTRIPVPAITRSITDILINLRSSALCGFFPYSLPVCPCSSPRSTL